MNDIDIYNKIAKELKKSKKEGLWLQCEIEADMDDKITKKLYVEKRYKEIKSENEIKTNKFERLGFTDVEDLPKSNKDESNNFKNDINYIKLDDKENKKNQIIACPIIKSSTLKINKINFKKNKTIKEGNIICEIETDDNLIDLECPYNGKIMEVFIELNEVIVPQQKLFEIEEEFNFVQPKKMSSKIDLKKKIDKDKPFEVVKNINALKEFSKVYHEYEIVNFNDPNSATEKVLEKNRKILFEGIQVLSEISKDLNPNIPTTYITEQVIDHGYVTDDRWTEVQLNFKEFQRHCLGIDELELVTRVLRAYTGFNNEDL